MYLNKIRSSKGFMLAESTCVKCDAFPDNLAHVIEQPNFRIPNPQYFVYLLDQTVGRDIL